VSNKDYRVVIDENGKCTRIQVKCEVKSGIRLGKRSGSGFHDERPNRQRTRQNQLRNAIHGQD
jgi:hypothetical protein